MMSTYLLSSLSCPLHLSVWAGLNGEGDAGRGVGGLLCFTLAASLGLLNYYVAKAREDRKIKPCLALPDIEACNDDGCSMSNSYDVVIVGAGPSGATAANYLGRYGIKTALIDAKKFPRNKPCGDAWCKPALDILEELGILEKMENDKIVHPVKRGGFISPFGHKCINTDGNGYGSVTGCKTYAIKRRIADEYIVRAASNYTSVSLFENTKVEKAEFKASAVHSVLPGEWQLTVTSQIVNSPIRGKILLICDGSTSYLAQNLGILERSESQAFCSHAYVKGSTHQWTEADGVMIFSRAVLPGYSALFKHYNGDMYLGTYILPGGKASSRSINGFEEEAIAHHPYISDAFGKHYEYEETRVVAPIRCGGIRRSYGKQVLVVGDAAGHVDPLTGEGIHTAMKAGKIAADVVNEMFINKNFSEASGRAYELRCYDSFGYEFWSSSAAAKLIYAFPVLLDAVAVVGQRRGQAFLDFFGEVMTGVRPKYEFLQPVLLFDIAIEIVKQIFFQYILRTEPILPSHIGVDLVEKHWKSKQDSVHHKKG